MEALKDRPTIVPMRLDGKDLCPEFEWLFDEEKSIRKDCYEVGFMLNIPSTITYTEEAAYFKIMDRCITTNGNNNSDLDWYKTLCRIPVEIENRFHKIRMYEHIMDDIQIQVEANGWVNSFFIDWIRISFWKY